MEKIKSLFKMGNKFDDENNELSSSCVTALESATSLLSVSPVSAMTSPLLSSPPLLSGSSGRETKPQRASKEAIKNAPICTGVMLEDSDKCIMHISDQQLTILNLEKSNTKLKNEVKDLEHHHVGQTEQLVWLNTVVQCTEEEVTKRVKEISRLKDFQDFNQFSLNLTIQALETTDADLQVMAEQRGRENVKNLLGKEEDKLVKKLEEDASGQDY